MIVVAGILFLVGGLRWISGPRDRELTSALDADRLERVETALSALEARLDQLQEQQNFLERLLGDRPDRQSLGPGDREGRPESGASDPGSILFDTGEGEGDR